jgi:hypothetical protein
MAIEKRLIDVWDLIEWLDNFDRENTLRILRGKKAKLLNSHAIKNMIVTVPRVDAVEVAHGRWEHTYEREFLKVKCTACGVVAIKANAEYTNNLTIEWAYCPNCGARMDLED